MTVQLPFEREDDHPLDLAPSLVRLQQDGVIHQVGTGSGELAWLVTGYDEVRGLLADERLGRSHPDPDSAVRWRGVLFGSPSGEYETEHADHARRRALMQPLFSPRRIRAFRPRVEQLTTALLDDLERQGPPADLQQALARPLPMRVICELLGVPYADRDRFYAWMKAAGATGEPTTGSPAEHGMGDLLDYALGLVARKRQQPGDDAISRLLAQDLSDEDTAKLTLRLLFVGQHTTVATIGMGILYLLAHPDQWQALTREPERVTAGIEEVLRTSGRILGGLIPRYTRTSLRVGDVTIPAGDLVLLDTQAANHDPGVFSCPGQFDITRDGPEHLAFGHGNRYCLGAPLARIELQALFTQLPARFPAMRFAVPVPQLRLPPHARIELPVEW